MRLQLLHELVTMTLGVYQSTSLSTILPNPPTPPKNAWYWCCFWQILCKHSAAQLRYWCCVSHLGFDTQKK